MIQKIIIMKDKVVMVEMVEMLRIKRNLNKMNYFLRFYLNFQRQY